MTEPSDAGESARALRAEYSLEMLIGSVCDYAIFMLDPSGRVETWNLGAQMIKGYRADEIVGSMIHAFYTPEDRAANKPELLLARAREHGRVEDEGWRVRKDGTRFWADVVITALRDAGGELAGYVKVTRDLTERREAELDRLQLAHTQEALRLRDEFLSIASHELRTPLVALQLQLDSLRNHGATLDARQVAKVDRATRNVYRLTELINTLMDASRIAHGNLNIALKRADLGAIVGEVVDRLQESAQAARCTIDADVATGITGSWDALRIGQLVSNLLANAFKYAPGAVVEVRLVRDGAHAVLTIADRGPGISAEHLERIFGRFERAASARNFGGLGLGLFIAREIVVAHDGTIHASNREGGGASFEVRLPLRDDLEGEK